MTASKPQPAQAGNLAAWAWIAVALTPFGWFFGALTIAFSYEGDHPVVRSVIIGLLLCAAAPTSAFILAVHAARDGHRSGRIAVMVSGLLFLATLVYLALWIWWIGLAVAAVAAVLVLPGARSRRIAVVVSGMLLLATLVVSTWQNGGWIYLVMAAVIVLVLVGKRSRNKPPPGPDGAQREEGSPAATAPPGTSGRTS